MINLALKTISRVKTNNQIFRRFLQVINYRFVNFPISSKYYHQPMPNHIQPSIKLIKSEQNLNEKCFLLEHLVELIEKDPKLFLS